MCQQHHYPMFHMFVINSIQTLTHTNTFIYIYIIDDYQFYIKVFIIFKNELIVKRRLLVYFQRPISLPKVEVLPDAVSLVVVVVVVVMLALTSAVLRLGVSRSFLSGSSIVLRHSRRETSFKIQQLFLTHKNLPKILSIFLRCCPCRRER